MGCCSFLNEAMRVADAKYEPTFDDILRARLQTVGVEEHRLVMETGERLRRVSVFLCSRIYSLRKWTAMDLLRRWRIQEYARWVIHGTCVVMFIDEPLGSFLGALLRRQ